MFHTPIVSTARRTVQVVVAAAAALAMLLLAGGTATAAPRIDIRTQPQHPVIDISDVYVFGLPPTYNDYFTCAGDYVYTDFVDADGDDANMSVQLTGYRPGHGFTHRTMDVSDGYHGVFFYEHLTGAAHYTDFWLRATDEDGLKSSWVHRPGCP